MATKAKQKRKRGEGKRGPHKGSGGRPPKCFDRRGRSILLCEQGEWTKMRRLTAGHGPSYPDRVRYLLGVARGSRAVSSKVARRWARQKAVRSREAMAVSCERSIYLGATEWAELAKLFPSGSWADKVRQLIDAADVKGEPARLSEVAALEAEAKKMNATLAKLRKAKANAEAQIKAANAEADAIRQKTRKARIAARARAAKVKLGAVKARARKAQKK